MPDIENSWRTAEKKGAEWVTASQPKNSRKNSQSTRKTAVLTVHFGHPQTCVYPDVCLGIAHVSGKVPLSGQGVW